jgi:hypothetical protein
MEDVCFFFKKKGKATEPILSAAIFIYYLEIWEYEVNNMYLVSMNFLD